MIHPRSRIVPTTPCIARILDEPIQLGEYRLDTGVSFNEIYMFVRLKKKNRRGFHALYCYHFRQ